MRIIKLIVAGLILFGCSDSSPPKPLLNHAGPESVEFSTTYQEPVFADSNRLQKIKATLPEVETIFKRHAEKNHYPGYVYGLVVDDSLIFSGVFGTVNISSQQPVTIESQFHIASMTKSFTAMAILKLRDEGKLSLLDQVSKYIPELANLRYLTRDAPPINVKNLLTMTSGFPEDNPWADRQLEDSDEELMSFLKDGISFSAIPSQLFEYSNLGYALLGTIVSRVSGITYQQYITDQILKPLGMTNTYWEYSEVPDNELAQGYRWEDEKWKEEPMLHTGAFGAIGGLITSMSDFSKYVALHLSAWPPRNEPEKGPIKRSSLREMHSPTAPRLSANSKDANNEPCPFISGYGYGLVIRKDCNGLLQVGHSGGLPGFGSNYRFYPEYGLGIISFSNLTYASAGSANDEAINMIFEQSGIEPRKLPISNVLKERTEQVIKLIHTWDKELGKEILAENFYLDNSREIRIRDANELMASAGRITSIDPLIPFNQLRGTFVMHGEKGDIKVFFSLSPEKVPRVQALNLWTVEKGQNSAN